MAPADASQQPGGNPPPSRASFATYADYIDHIGSKSGSAYEGYGDELARRLLLFPYLLLAPWHTYLTLIRFYKDGKPSLVQCSTDENSFNRLRDILGTLDESVEYQVVILHSPSDQLPPTQIVDTIGLGLDMDPEVWRYLSRLDRKQNSYEPIIWMRRDDMIHVEEDVLLVLDARSKVRPLTGSTSPETRPACAECFGVAFLFLGPLRAPIKREEAEYLSPYTRMFPPDAPSSLLKQSALGSQATGSHGHPHEDLKSSAVTRWILNAATDSPRLGPKNVLFPCLEALLRWQMCTTPEGVAALPGLTGLEEKVRSKYFQEWGDKAEPGFLWHILRDGVDARRTTLIALPNFVMNNFDTQEKGFARAYEKLHTRYERYVRELEMEEARLRDHIDFHRSTKSTDMAELSIRESKRVMLLTILAFVFVPASLASSIYGMNIQQINGTGHDIRFFAITAVVLLLTTLVLWAGGSILREYRLHRLVIIRRRVEVGFEPSWYDGILSIRSWSQVLGWGETFLNRNSDRDLSLSNDALLGKFLESVLRLESPS